MNTLKHIEEQLNQEINIAKEKVESGLACGAEDFNIRGELYRLAFEVAPNARYQDMQYVYQWIQPKRGEVSLDIAAGTGFVTKYLAEWTGNTTYATDPSDVQLDALKKRCAGLPVITVEGSLSEDSTMQTLNKAISTIDIITSFGGIHHAIDEHGENKQKKIFQNAAKLLKPGGRFVAVDVGARTSLATHFETSVKDNCLTSHEEKWLSKERLEGELIEGTDLRYVKSEIIPIQWVFDSVYEMALFMKGLHAYDMSTEAIAADLNTILGYEEKNGKVYLNWPLLFFHLEKKK